MKSRSLRRCNSFGCNMGRRRGKRRLEQRKKDWNNELPTLGGLPTIYPSSLDDSEEFWKKPAISKDPGHHMEIVRPKRSLQKSHKSVSFRKRNSRECETCIPSINDRKPVFRSYIHEIAKKPSSLPTTGSLRKTRSFHYKKRNLKKNPIEKVKYQDLGSPSPNGKKRALMKKIRIRASSLDPVKSPKNLPLMRELPSSIPLRGLEDKDGYTTPKKKSRSFRYGSSSSTRRKQMKSPVKNSRSSPSDRIRAKSFRTSRKLVFGENGGITNGENLVDMTGFGSEARQRVQMVAERHLQDRMQRTSKLINFRNSELKNLEMSVKVLDRGLGKQ